MKLLTFNYCVLPAPCCSLRSPAEWRNSSTAGPTNTTKHPYTVEGLGTNNQILLLVGLGTNTTKHPGRRTRNKYNKILLLVGLGTNTTKHPGRRTRNEYNTRPRLFVLGTNGLI